MPVLARLLSTGTVRPMRANQRLFLMPWTLNSKPRAICHSMCCDLIFQGHLAIKATVSLPRQRLIVKTAIRNIRLVMFTSGGFTFNDHRDQRFVKGPSAIDLQGNISGGILRQYNGILRQCSVSDLLKLVHCIYKIRTKPRV